MMEQLIAIIESYRAKFSPTVGSFNNVSELAEAIRQHDEQEKVNKIRVDIEKVEQNTIIELNELMSNTNINKIIGSFSNASELKNALYRLPLNDYTENLLSYINDIEQNNIKKINEFLEETYLSYLVGSFTSISSLKDIIEGLEQDENIKNILCNIEEIEQGSLLELENLLNNASLTEIIGPFENTSDLEGKLTGFRPNEGLNRLRSNIKTIDKSNSDQLIALTKQVKLEHPIICTVNNYSKLENAVKELEFRESVNNLQKLLAEIESTDIAQLKKVFKENCQQRENVIINSALSFTAGPDNKANKLYRTLTETLFETTKFSEIIAILMPSVTTYLKIKWVAEGKIKVEHMAPVIHKRGIADAKKAIDGLDFTTIITDGVNLLSIEKAIQLPFYPLSKLLSKLAEDYPTIYTKLKNHNFDIVNLIEKAEIISTKGTPPRQALEQLIKGLRLGGQKYSGSEYEASPKAWAAIFQFQNYLNFLPNDLKSAVEKLTASTGKNFKEIFNTIKPSYQADSNIEPQCVEMAAGLIQSILDSSSAQEVLGTIPSLTKKERNAIIKSVSKYETFSEFNVQGFESNHKLPIELAQTFLSKVNLAKASQFGEFLAGFDRQYYSVILGSKMNLPFSLNDNFAQIVIHLDNEQLKTFLQLYKQKFQKSFLNISDFARRIRVLSFEQIELIYDINKEFIKSLTKNSRDLALLTELFRPQDRLKIIEDFKDKFANLFTSVNQLLSYIRSPVNSSIKFADLFALFKDALPDVIYTYMDCREIIKQQSTLQENILTEAVIAKIVELIDTVEMLKLILTSLSNEQSIQLITIAKAKILSLFPSLADFTSFAERSISDQALMIFQENKEYFMPLINTIDDAISLLSINKLFLYKPQKYPFDTIKDRLPALINTADDYSKLMAKLSNQQQKDFNESMKERLADIITNLSELNTVIKYQTDEQKDYIIEAVKNKIPGWVSSVDDIYLLAEILAGKQLCFLFTTYNEHFKPFIKDLDDLISITCYSTDQGWENIYNIFSAFKAHLPELIPNRVVFTKLLSYFDENEKLKIVDLVQAHLPSLVNSLTIFKVISNEITSQQRHILAEAVKDRLPNYVQSLDDIEDLANLLSLEHLLYIFTKGKEHFKKYFTSIANFVKPFKMLRPEWVKDILFIYKDHIQTLIKNSEDYLTLLKSFPIEQWPEIIDNFKDKLYELTRSNNEFVHLLLFFKKTWELSDNIIGHLPNMIHSIDHLKYLDILKQPISFDRIKDRIPSLIKSIDDFERLLLHFSSIPKELIIDSCKDRLSLLINDGGDIISIARRTSLEQFNYLLILNKKAFIQQLPNINIVSSLMMSLSDEQVHVLLNHAEDHILAITQSLNDFAHLFRCLPNKARLDFISIFKDKLPSLITSLDEYRHLMWQLKAEEKYHVNEIIKDKLLILADSISKFKDIIKSVTPKQLVDMLKANPNALLLLVKTSGNLYELFYLLETDKQNILFNHLKLHIVSLIKSADEFNCMFRELSDEQRSIIFDSIKEQIPGFIKTKMDLKQVFELFYRDCFAEIRGEIFNKNKDTIIALIDDSYSFNYIFSYLSEAERDELFKVVNDKVISFMYSHYSHDRIFEVLSESQRMEVVIKYLSDIPKLLEPESYFDLKAILKCLTSVQRQYLIESCKDSLHILIGKHWDRIGLLGLEQSDLDFILSKLTNKQKDYLVNKIDNEFSTLIDKAIIFTESLLLFSDEQCLQLCLNNKIKLNELEERSADVAKAVKILPPAKFKIVCETLKEYILNNFQKPWQIHFLLTQLSMESHDVFFDVFKQELLNNLSAIITDLKPEKAKILCDKLKPNLADIIKSLEDLKRVSKSIPKDQYEMQHSHFFEAFKDYIPAHIKTRKDYDAIRQYLTLDQKQYIDGEIAKHYCKKDMIKPGEVAILVCSFFTLGLPANIYKAQQLNAPLNQIFSLFAGFGSFGIAPTIHVAKDIVEKAKNNYRRSKGFFNSYEYGLKTTKATVATDNKDEENTLLLLIN